MKLYYMPGASSLLPHIVLVEAGLSFAAVKVDEHTKAIDGDGDYRSLNPLGYVPALQLEDGSVLTEAAAIAQYVADQVPAKNLAPPRGRRSCSHADRTTLAVAAACGGAAGDRDHPDAVAAVILNGLAVMEP